MSVAIMPGEIACGIICAFGIRGFDMAAIRVCPSCGQRNRIPAKYLAMEGKCGACKSMLPALAEPLAADEALFDEVVQNSPVPVLIDFWAAWCGPCRAAAPEVERRAADMAGQALVLKVDTDRYPQLAGRFDVRGIPNFVVTFRGRPVTQQAGLVDHNTMEQWLRSAVTSAA